MMGQNGHPPFIPKVKGTWFWKKDTEDDLVYQGCKCPFKYIRNKKKCT